MSLPRPPNRKPFFGPTLIGACTGMILCIPLAAYTAAALGDDYNTRALIYCGFLLWCASLWLWPLLLLPGLFRKRS